MKKIYSFLMIILSIFLTTACAQQNPEYVMTVDELKKEIEENPNLVILDVRTEAELVGPLGKIDGVINIPIQLLANKLNELEPYKDKDIAVICRTGNRSTTGTEILVENGYKARNVLGGMVAYNKVKLP